MIKFIRGEQAKYFANDAYLSTYADSLYFATDTGVLYVNGQDYGSRYPFKDVQVETVKADAVTEEMPTAGLYLKLAYRDENLGEKVVFVAPFADASTDGLMSAEYAETLDALKAIMDADGFGKVDGVAEGDKILSLGEDKLLSATLDIDYLSDETGKWLRLLGKDGAVVAKVDASPFVADGMLEDVEVVTVDGTKYVEFTWNVLDVATGESKKDRIALSEIATDYVAGQGITIEGGTISAKLDASTANMLKVSEAGLMLDEVTTDATVLQKEIKVAGLANGKLGNYKDGDTISAGTDIYTILQSILSKEEYPTGAKINQNASLTSAFAKPSFQLTNSGSTVEVGTSVTVDGVTGYTPTPSTKSRTYTGFTNGYSLKYGDEQVIVTGNPSSVSVTDVELESGTYTLKREYTGAAFGKTGAALTTTSSTSIATDCSIASETLVVKEGTNTVKYTMSGPGHKGKVAESPTYYIVSNLGNTKSDKKVNGVSASTPSIAAADSSSNSLSVTGSYKYYVGYSTSKPQTTADIKKLTTFSGWVSDTIKIGDGSSIAGTAPGGNYMCVAVPPAYSLNSVVDANNFQCKDAFNTTADPQYTVDYVLADESTVAYKVYVCKGIGDFPYKYVEIVK